MGGINRRKNYIIVTVFLGTDKRRREQNYNEGKEPKDVRGY